jgi:hypothetical protein
MAVGAYHDISANEDLALAESWNGTYWSIVSTTDGGGTGELESIFCTSSTNCVATGAKVTPGGNQKTSIASWNGDTWSENSSPSKGRKVDLLGGVSCTSSTDCVTVGFYQSAKTVGGHHPDKTLVETGS